MKERIVTVYMAIFISLLLPLNVFAVDILVSTPVTAKNINSAIATAKPGDTVIVPDGTYSDLNQIVVPSDVDGTEANPITLKPATPGGVTFTGNPAGPRVMFIHGSWWIIRDFKFIDVSEIGNAHTYGIVTTDTTGTRITNNYFQRFGDLVNEGKQNWPIWIAKDGSSDNARIDYNTFIDNEAMNIHVSVAGINTKIDHNYFKNTSLSKANAMMIGTGDTPANNAMDLYTIVEYNIFEDMHGNKPVCNKSSSNTYRYNVFRKIAGLSNKGLVLRMGDDCIVDGNYFFGVQGQNIRVHGTGHKIINNYFENPDYSAILLAAGNGTGGSDYAYVSDILIANNTIINPVWRGIHIGFWPGCGVKPNNLTFKNNIIKSSVGNLVKDSGHTGTFTWTTNLHYATGSANHWENDGGGNEPGSGITHANPNLQKGQYIYRLQASSTNAINKGVRDINVTTDIEGDLRDASPDIGCDEFSGTTGRPVSESEVGVSWLRQGILEPPANLNLVMHE